MDQHRTHRVVPDAFRVINMDISSGNAKHPEIATREASSRRRREYRAPYGELVYSLN